MPGQTDDRELHPNGGFEEPGTDGLYRAAAELSRAAQLISPKSNEQGIGSTVGLGQTAASLLPYDRNRVRAIIKVPANQPGTATAQLGGIYVGLKEDVRAGGGYYLAPGDSLTVESISELAGIATANPVYVGVFIERQGGDVV